MKKGTPEQKAPIPARSIELKARTLKKAFLEAETHLAAALVFDNPLISTKAEWRKGAALSGATARQIEAIAAKGLLTAEELKHISKLTAWRVLTLNNLKEKTLLALGKMPAGKFEGTELALLSIRIPGYLEGCLGASEKGSEAEKWRATPAIERALEQNPIPWIEKNRRGTFKRHIEPTLKALNERWNTGDPDDRAHVRAFLATALDTDPTQPWAQVLGLAAEREAILKSQTPPAPQKAKPAPPRTPVLAMS